MNYLKINKGYRLQFEPAQQGYVLLFPEGMVKLNQSCYEILTLCDGKHNQNEIINTLQSKYGDVAIEKDIQEFLNTALENGWIHYVNN